MKNLILLIAAFILVNPAYSQKTTSLAFETETHDFGDIHEEKGPVSFDFLFMNIGQEKYQIEDVVSSCGCTTPAYSTDPVKPGKQGFIRATYDPTNLRGRFSKTITISGNTKGKVVLTITGNVIPRPRTIMDDYPAVMGNLRFKVNHVVLGEVYENTIDTGYIEVMNPSDAEITINYIKMPEHIRSEVMPVRIKSGEKKQIAVYYSAYIKEDLGYSFDRIYLQTDDKLKPEKEMIVVANIIKNVQILTEEELKNAGKIEFEKKEVDFKTLSPGEIKHTTFKFKNTGNDQLVIYNTKTDCGCTASTLGKMRYEPGEEGSLKVTFNSKGKSGKVQQTIVVTTNDPNQPEVFLLIRAKVLTATN
jgi:hypothetical protein